MSDAPSTPPSVPPAYAAAVAKQKTATSAVPARRLTVTTEEGVRYVVTGPTFGSVEQEIAKIHGSVPAGSKAVFRSPIPNGPGRGWIASGYLA